MKKNPPHATVRFWQYLNKGFVRITLRPDQTLKWSKFERTEEGNSWESETWTYGPDGVTCEWANGGRDCDGPISRSGELFCPFDSLAVNAPSITGDYDQPPLPAWEEIAPTVVNDTFARQMGY